MKFFRYENKFGTGPYRNVPDGLWDMIMEHGDKRHPNLEEDELDNFCNSIYYSGCNSIESLYDWFSNWHKELFNNEFTIKIYESNFYKEGKSKLQFMFTKDNLIDSINDFEELIDALMKV